MFKFYKKNKIKWIDLLWLDKNLWVDFGSINLEKKSYKKLLIF